jgi:hypothetical protein
MTATPVIPPPPPAAPTAPAVKPHPMINAQFWFNMSATMVTNAIDNVNKAIATINTMVVWGFGVYTGSSIFTVEFKKITELPILAILVAPYIIFIYVYWQSIMAETPVSVTIDPRSPKTIEKAYIETYNNKVKELKRLKKNSLLAMGCLATALVTAYCLKNGQKDIVIAESSIYGKADPETKALYIAGKFPADSLLRITLQAYFQDTVHQQSAGKDVGFKLRVTEKDTSILLVSGHDGKIAQSYAVKPNEQKLAISIGWNDQAYRKSLEKVFVFKPYNPVPAGKPLP